MEAAAETMRKATEARQRVPSKSKLRCAQLNEAFRKLEDVRWTGRSMLGTALALVGRGPVGPFKPQSRNSFCRHRGVEDEDQQMDGERLAEDAKET